MSVGLQVESRDLELALIDDPELPARETMDDAKLQELASSIATLGLIEPIAVKPSGARYQVIAGHRRRLASILAGLLTVPCRIYPDDPLIVEAIKLHENTKREDLNAGEEAVYFAELLEKLAGGDVDRLAELVKETRHYVESRLLLLRGDEEVLAALKRGEINLAVANELNRIRDLGYRRMYLEAARKGGASARMVKDWRVQYDLQAGAIEAAGGTVAPTAENPDEPRRAPFECLLCGEDHDPHDMDLVYIHRPCLRVYERLSGTPLRGLLSAAPAPTPARGEGSADETK